MHKAVNIQNDITLPHFVLSACEKPEKLVKYIIVVILWHCLTPSDGTWTLFLLLLTTGDFPEVVCVDSSMSFTLLMTDLSRIHCIMSQADLCSSSMPMLWLP